MILTIGTAGFTEQEEFGAVENELRLLGCETVLYRQEKCLDGEYMSFETGNDDLQFVLDIDGESYPLSAFDTVWYRHPVIPPDLLNFEPERYRPFIAAQFGALRRGLWHLMHHARWINNPWRAQAADTKIMQLVQARSVGLSIPPTLITTDPQRVREFWAHFGGNVIVKQLHTAPMWKEAIWTSKVTEEDIAQIDSVRMCPAIFQAEIPKLYELRIAIFGPDMFVAMVDSQIDPGTALDWRSKPEFSDTNLTFQPATLPAQVAHKLRLVLENLGLNYGAFDLIYTPSEEYVFLEVNPSGQWYFMQREAGFPIANSVARMLAGQSNLSTVAL